MTVTPTPEKQENKNFFLRHKKLTIVLVCTLAFIIALSSTLFIMIKIGEAKLRENLVAYEKLETAEDDIDDSAIYYNGKAYYYNDKLINILLLGIDKKSTANNKRGQADALFLVSVDTDSSHINIVPISRNTLCKFDVYNDDDEVFGTQTSQICLAYSYGSNKVNSSENCVKAVSSLLYNLPINGYYTIYLDSISKIVDAVGGVKLTMPDDIIYTVEQGQAGKTFTMNGKEALTYLIYRNDSNAGRVENHKEFIMSFINSAKTAFKKDISLPFKIANSLKNDTTTNIDVTSAIYLATEALNWKLDFINIKGEYSVVDNKEVYTVDEEALKPIILDNFYISKQ